MIGVVKWFNATRGYGFIDSAGKDYFVHFKQIKSEGYKSLNEGDKVEFMPATSEKGEIATQVQVYD